MVYSKNPGFCKDEKSLIRISGFVEGCALVHPKTPVKEAIKLLRKDLVLSIKHRLELSSESFSLNENPFLKKPSKAHLYLPKRLFFTMQHCVVGNYCLSNSEEETAENQVRTLLSSKPLYSESSELLHQKPSQKPPEKPTRNSNPVTCLVASVVIFVLLLTSFFLKTL